MLGSAHTVRAAVGGTRRERLDSRRHRKCPVDAVQSLAFSPAVQSLAFSPAVQSLAFSPPVQSLAFSPAVRLLTFVYSSLGWLDTAG